MARGFHMLKIKIRVYNARDKECSLCGATPDHLWKFGPVSVEVRAHHFCDGCMNLLDDSTAKA